MATRVRLRALFSRMNEKLTVSKCKERFLFILGITMPAPDCLSIPAVEEQLS